jgi:hypothetical protein
MPQARVDSFDALTLFKAALWKFQEAATIALGDAESELHRIQMWLETEQQSFWQMQIRKRQEIVSRCKEAVRMKKVFKDSTGRQQSAVDEEKALQVAQRKLEEAEQKLANTGKWSRVLQKEIELYKGGVARFASDVQSEIPAAAAHLEKLSAKLDAYVAVQPGASGESTVEPAGAVSEPSMARGGAALPVSGELAHARELGPSSEQRQTAPLVAVLSFGLPTILDDQASAIATVPTNRSPLSDEAKIFVGQSVRAQEGVIAHREAEIGWYVAPAGSAERAGWEAIRADQLLANHPNWGNLLALPTGFSVIMDGDGVAAVFDADERVVWRRA